jgi:hypothetical protein
MLIVDGDSGYNVVAAVSRSKRAACHAHLRRYFYEALPTAPIAQEAIDLILGLYRVSAFPTLACRAAPVVRDNDVFVNHRRFLHNTKDFMPRLTNSRSASHIVGGRESRRGTAAARWSAAARRP